MSLLQGLRFININIEVFWDLTLRILLNSPRRFERSLPSSSKPSDPLFLDCWALNMKILTCFNKIRGSIYWMTQHNISEDLKLLQHRCENLRSYKNTPNKRTEMLDISYFLVPYFPPFFQFCSYFGMERHTKILIWLKNISIFYPHYII